MTISDRLFEAIAYLGLSPYRVAKEIHISAGSLTNYKKGTSEPRRQILELFSDRFNISLEWLINGTGEMIHKGNVIDEQTERFIKAIDYVKTSMNLSYREIITAIDAYPTVLSELKKGKSTVKFKWVEKMCKIYGISNEYIIFGTGDLTTRKKESDCCNDVESLKHEISILRTTIEELKRDKEFLKGLLDKLNK